MIQLITNLEHFLKQNFLSAPFWTFNEIQSAAVQLRVTQEFPLAQQEVGEVRGGGITTPHNTLRVTGRYRFNGRKLTPGRTSEEFLRSQLLLEGKLNKT